MSPPGANPPTDMDQFAMGRRGSDGKEREGGGGGLCGGAAEKEHDERRWEHDGWRIALQQLCPRELPLCLPTSEVEGLTIGHNPRKGNEGKEANGGAGRGARLGSHYGCNWRSNTSASLHEGGAIVDLSPVKSIVNLVCY